MNIKAITGSNIKHTTELINNEMPRFVRYLNGFRNRMGEKQDIYINAVGTGIVAPIFIMNNPISKEDKNTKIYSALRQTAMTVTGIFVQTIIAIPLINKYLDKQIEKGNFGEKFDANKERITANLNDKKNIFSEDELLEKATKIVTERLANIRALKRIVNLIAVFTVIPISCALMNKTFPKFMEKCFPKIANEKSEVQNG